MAANRNIKIMQEFLDDLKSREELELFYLDLGLYATTIASMTSTTYFVTETTRYSDGRSPFTLDTFRKDETTISIRFEYSHVEDWRNIYFLYKKEGVTKVAMATTVNELDWKNYTDNTIDFDISGFDVDFIGDFINNQFPSSINHRHTFQDMSGNQSNAIVQAKSVLSSLESQKAVGRVQALSEIMGSGVYAGEKNSFLDFSSSQEVTDLLSNALPTLFNKTAFAINNADTAFISEFVNSVNMIKELQMANTRVRLLGGNISERTAITPESEINILNLDIPADPNTSALTYLTPSKMRDLFSDYLVLSYNGSSSISIDTDSIIDRDAVIIIESGSSFDTLTFLGSSGDPYREITIFNLSSNDVTILSSDNADKGAVISSLNNLVIHIKDDQVLFTNPARTKVNVLDGSGDDIILLRSCQRCFVDYGDIGAETTDLYFDGRLVEVGSSILFYNSFTEPVEVTIAPGEVTAVDSGEVIGFTLIEKHATDYKQDVYMVSTGSGSGTSVSVYEVDFEVLKTDRFVIGIDENGDIGKADNNTLFFRPLGITADAREINGGTAWEITVQKIAKLDGFSGLTDGHPIFLGNTGNIIQDLTGLAFGAYRVPLGYAVGSDTIDIQLGDPVQNMPNEINTNFLPVGAEISVPVLDYVPDTFLEEDGSRVLKATYPRLAEIFSSAGYPYGSDTDGFNLPNWSLEGLTPKLIKVRNGGSVDPVEHASIDTRLLDLETFDSKLLDNVLGPLNKDLVRNDISADQELFIDSNAPSVITSNGRTPIDGMGQGTWIPPMIEIDGEWYPNPSCINIEDVLTNGAVDEAKDWTKLKGSYGFFEDWENAPWKSIDDWSSLPTGVWTKEGDWLKFVSGGVGGAYLNYAYTPTIGSYQGGLFKKGNKETLTWLTTGGGSQGVYTFSTGALVDPEGKSRAIKLSDELVYIETLYAFTTPGGPWNIRVEADEYFYMKDVWIRIDSAFTPPFGQDGHSANDARAYNFNGWDKPISFSFKPQFDYDIATGIKHVVNDFLNSSFNFYFGYESTKYFRLTISATNYYFGYDGSSWDGGTTSTGDATAFANNSFLQTEHDVTIYLDNTSSTNNIIVNLDGDSFSISQDISAVTFNSVISIGGIPLYSSPDLYYSNCLISNLCIHPTTATLPVDQSISFTDPGKQYGKDNKSSYFLDKFGNTSSVSQMIASAGGVIEEGENVNGSYIIYENGLKMCFSYVGCTYVDIARLHADWYFPVKFQGNNYDVQATMHAYGNYAKHPIISVIAINEELSSIDVCSGLNTWNSGNAQNVYLLAIGF